jgi:hypothetical protein
MLCTVKDRFGDQEGYAQKWGMFLDAAIVASVA